MIGGTGSIQGGSSGFSIPNSILQGYLQRPGFRNILDGLGIRLQDVSNVKNQKGIQTDIKIQELQVLQLDMDKAAAIKALGLGDVSLAIIVQAQDEVKKIKKRLEEIESSRINKEQLKELLQILGLSADEETIVYSDQDGGLVVIRNALNELQSSADD